MNKTWLDNFPSDVQIDILKRLPFKTLVALMITSRSIYSIVTSPTLMLATLVPETGYYIYSYPSSTGGEQLFSVYRDTANKLRFVKSIDSISIDSNYFFLGSIYGLVCFAKKFGRLNDCDIILWNPFLGISRTLPFLAAACEKSDGLGLGLGLGFGFDHSSVDYKVVRIGILSNYSTRVWADVYGLRAKKWQKVTGSVSRLASRIIGDGIFMNDSLHWILKFTRFYRGQNYDEYGILSYNLAKNVFNEMEIDEKIIGYNKRMVLKKLTINEEEKLVLYCDEQQREFCVWVMEEYNVAGSWRELRIIKNNVRGESFTELHTRKNGDIVISTSNGVLFSYSIEGNKTTTPNERTRAKLIDYGGPQLDYVGPLMGSLAFVDDRGGGFVCGKGVVNEEDEESKNNRTQKRIKDLNGGYYCYNPTKKSRLERPRSLDGKIHENISLLVNTDAVTL